ncbi:hypothetical protein [Pyrobaculum neutrophilum]|nr:hypothetical protein [Pyrobaculum neutrophilum]
MTSEAVGVSVFASQLDGARDGGDVVGTHAAVCVGAGCTADCTRALYII